MSATCASAAAASAALCCTAVSLKLTKAQRGASGARYQNVREFFLSDNAPVGKYVVILDTVYNILKRDRE